MQRMAVSFFQSLYTRDLSLDSSPITDLVQEQPISLNSPHSLPSPVRLASLHKALCQAPRRSSARTLRLGLPPSWPPPPPTLPSRLPWTGISTSSRRWRARWTCGEPRTPRGIPRFISLLRGYLESCRFLVEESGIDVNSVSKTGATPMSYAALEGNVQVMRYLLDRGGDHAMPDERGSTPLHHAALRGHCEAVRLLLSKGVPVDPVDHRGAPLHLAASKDHVEVVKVLLEHAADLNKVVNHIVSPLMIALCGKSLKCIKLLIEAGADVNALGSSAPTPLVQAVHGGLTDSIKLLLEAGADPNIPDQQGATPIEQAN
ncbi:hypothetical protein ACQ4PT_038615 [Festuca glaucescens]